MKGNILRIKLENALKAKYPDYLTLDEINEICADPVRKYKNTNAERRFRNDKKAQGSTIKAEKIWNDRHTAIIGYKWIPTDRVEVPIIGTIKDERVVFNKPKQNTLLNIRRMD
jgi:hypothetical protein